jgi:hypothetical protein
MKIKVITIIVCVFIILSCQISRQVPVDPKVDLCFQRVELYMDSIHSIPIIRHDSIYKQILLRENENKSKIHR